MEQSSSKFPSAVSELHCEGDHRHQGQQQHFASAPACLRPANTAVSLVEAAATAASSPQIPRATSSVDRTQNGACTQSEGIIGREASGVDASISATAPFSVAMSGGMGTAPGPPPLVSARRVSAGGRRMPGMVKKSLQEQELRELLEAASNRTTPPSPPLNEDGHEHANTKNYEEKRSPRAGSPIQYQRVGDEDARQEQRQSSMPHLSSFQEPAGSRNIGDNKVVNSSSSSGNKTEKGNLSNASGRSKGISAFEVREGGGGTAVAAIAARATETHPMLELYRSIRDPLDQLSFEELKRRLTSAVEEDGAGRGSMSKLVDFLAGLKRFSDDDLKQLRDYYPQRTGEEGKEEEGEEGAWMEIEDDDDSSEGSCGDVEEEGGAAAESPANFEADGCCGSAAGPPSGAAPSAPGSLSHVILKFTTVADGNEAPSFAVGREGATVGRGPCNDISIPSDSCMGMSDHASIVWRGGAFHVQDRGHPYGASIRIGTGRGLRDWPLDQGSMFSAGNSVFHTKEIDEERGILLEIVAGPLKGERRRVHRDGATVGRATENTISIADRELSRHHSIVECEDTRHLSEWGSRGGGDAGGADAALGGTVPRDGRSSNYSGGPEAAEEEEEEEEEDAMSTGEAQTEGDGRLEFFLCDVGSTNGTYVQLVGPYASSRRLELGDHILIGRTGFSINRFDWGVWDDRGSRRSMEDKSVVIQDMGVESLTALGLGPQTFLAVYDGHGGAEASAFLWRRLHLAVGEALGDATGRIAAALRQDRAAEREAVFGSGGGGEAMRCADRDGDTEIVSASSWMSPGFFSSGSGARGLAGMPPLPPTTTTTTATTATNAEAPRLALAGSGAAGVAAHSTEGNTRGVGLWKVYDATGATPAVAAAARSSVSENHSRAPSLPQEWLLPARAKAGAVRSSSAANANASDTAIEQLKPRSPPGGEAANGVLAEVDGAGGRQGGAEHGGHGESDGEGLRESGLASPPPTSMGGRGLQSPGGGPSQPLPSAGLPAGGGGLGTRKNGGGGVERQKGSTAVDRVIEDVVSRAFLDTDEEFLTTAIKPSCGSTATTAMIIGDRFYSFNLGDSRTILCRSGRPELVSLDHKPNRSDETERIKRAGGMVIHKRVMGELAVSRAFGDRAFKMGIKAILREEEVYQQELADQAAEDEEAAALDPTRTIGNPYGISNDDVATAPPALSEDGDSSDVDLSAADANKLTMGRGSMSSGQLLPPLVAAPQAPPAAPPTSPPPQPPVAGSRLPVTDPTDALITAQPEMLSCKITPEDEFVLLACDGLFDVFSNEEVVQFVREEMRTHGDTQRVCQTLTRKAIDERYTRDNVSIVLVVLKKFW